MTSSLVLVTGATGFIGRALLPALTAAGYGVRAAVRKHDRLYEIPPASEVSAIGEIGTDTDWDDALKEVDAVVHLAGPAHILKDNSADSSALFRRVNVTGTKRLAQMAADRGVRRFIYLSSVKANGEGASEPYSEKDTPAPEDCYGKTKLEAEEALCKIASATGMEVVILRSPLVYGPQVRANFLRLIKLVDRGIPLPLSSIRNRRSMIYLGNLVHAVLTCINHPRAAGETFLVSDGHDLPTGDLITMLALALGKRPRIFPFPHALLRTFGKITGMDKELAKLTGSLCIDSGKIRTLLNWQPPFTVEEGIGETIRWYKEKQDKL